MSKREKQTANEPLEDCLKRNVVYLNDLLTKSKNKVESLSREKGGYIASNNAYRKRIEQLKRELDVEAKMLDFASNKCKELASDREGLIKINKQQTYTLYIVSSVLTAVILYLIFN